MFPFLRSLMMAVLLALAGAQASRADVILTFSQTGPIMRIPYGNPTGTPQPRDGVVHLQFVFTDDAFAQGVDWNAAYPQSGPPHWLLDGMVQVYFGITDFYEGFSVNMWDIANPNRFLFDRYATIDVATQPSGMPTGSIFYSWAGLTQIQFQFNGSSMVTGFIGAEAGCNAVPAVACTFSGTLMQSVPEPASILTFGMGLVALGAAIRQRRMDKAS